MISLVFVNVCTLTELRNNGRKVADVKGEKVLLIFKNGRVYACSNICPHAGFNLDYGEVNQEEITCPLHAHMFNLEDGNCLSYPGYKLKIYKVKVKDDAVNILIE